MAEPIDDRARTEAKYGGAAVRVGPGGEVHQVVDARHPTLTTAQGIPVSDDQNSLKAGARGPTLLEDFHFPGLTRADPFQRVGEKTPAFVRFSTVAGSKLLMVPAARDFIADAVAHRKFIAYSADALPLFQKAGVADAIDDGFHELKAPADAFVALRRKVRFWDRARAER